MPNEPFHLNWLDQSIFNLRGVGCSNSFFNLWYKFLWANGVDPCQTPSEYEARRQTATFSYSLVRTTKEMLCVCVREHFWSTNYDLKTGIHLYTCIAACKLSCTWQQIQCLYLSHYPDPRVLTLYRPSDAMQVSLLVCVSLSLLTTTSFIIRYSKKKKLMYLHFILYHFFVY